MKRGDKHGEKRGREREERWETTERRREEKGVMVRMHDKKKENSLYADFPPHHHQRVRVTECADAVRADTCVCELQNVRFLLLPTRLHVQHTFACACLTCPLAFLGFYELICLLYLRAFMLLCVYGCL